jgi:hypothetical protein
MHTACGSLGDGSFVAKQFPEICVVVGFSYIITGKYVKE